MKKFNIYKKYLILAIIFILVFLPICDLKAEGVINILDIKAEELGGGIVQIEWSTNEITGGKIVFGEDADYMPFYVIDGNQPSRFHKIKIGNLKSKTTYYYKITVSNNSQEAASFVKSFKTTEYKDEYIPEINNLKIAYVSGTVAVLSWESNENANSVVLYDANKKYKTKVENKNNTKSHLVALKKLKPNTTYYTRVYSTDKSGNKSNILFKEFTTSPTKVLDSEDLTFSYFRPSGPSDTQITSNSIKVTFKTNHFSKGKITISKGKKSLGAKIFEYNTEHSAEFTGLKANTEYSIAVSMTDIYGKKKNTTLNISTTKLIYDALIPQAENDKDEEVTVLGQEYSFYTSAVALYKTVDSSRVYSIVNNKKHYITSAQSFLEYGYGWNKIKTVNKSVLAGYSRVKLVKGPVGSNIYYLHENANGEILKIKIPSPNVFNSYKSNSWSDIVKINQYDLDSYKEVELIKTADSQDIYYLNNGNKQRVSSEVFKKKGFRSSDVMVVNKAHLDSYKTISDLK